MEPGGPVLVIRTGWRSATRKVNTAQRAVARVVLKQNDSLSVVNSLRMDDAGLAALDALGKVEHVIRLAGFHGMDDPFYKGGLVCLTGAV